MKENYTFFWGSSSPFSNWYKGGFTYEDRFYNCSEQYMMYAKAKLFGDDFAAEQILATSNPREQKRLGRTIKNFSEAVWMLNCIDIMVPALVEKFKQDEACSVAMYESCGTIIVEASPVDGIWGIGLAADDPRAWDPETWQGKNLLGVCLMKARGILWPK